MSHSILLLSMRDRHGDARQEKATKNVRNRKKQVDGVCWKGAIETASLEIITRQWVIFAAIFMFLLSFSCYLFVR